MVLDPLHTLTPYPSKGDDVMLTGVIPLRVTRILD